MTDSRDSRPFVHLHVHSEYSLLDGLSRIDQLAQRAKELKMPALALTDHGTMHGTIQFYRACMGQGIKPIIGVESYLAKRRLCDKDPNLDRDRYHLLLLAQNQSGYQNLLKLVSKAQLDGFYYRPRTDHEALEQLNHGLITTTGCLSGEIPRAIVQGNVKLAYSLMSWYVDVFGRERFFVELQQHNIPELKSVNQTLMEMARHYDLGFLATNDVHYTTATEAEAHDVLLCIQTGKPLVAKDRMRMSDDSYYLKSRDEMERLFGDIPGAMSNTLLVAEMCDVNPEPAGYHLPKFNVPEGYDAASYLRYQCEKGLAKRYGEEKIAFDSVLRDRLNYELSIINGMGFDAYFLIVWDLCEFARSKDIWWNVRGSGAGSLVAYSLGITEIDPIEVGLIFERFLNPDRVSMPDIDLDYPDDRRHEMIEYAIDKYGSDKVAQIITFGTLGARAAIRDVGRTMNTPLSEVDSIARLIPAIPGKPVTIKEVLDPNHEFFSAELLKRYKEDEDIKALVDTALNLEGVARHASTHAAGVIISDKPLVEYTPLHRPTSSSSENGKGIGVVTQWPMEILESIGLLKVDFLGLSTLTIMRKAADLIEDRHEISYDMSNIPYDVGHVGPDPNLKSEALFEMLGRGEVAGVFQVESAGMRRLMLRMKPRKFDHIVAAISLFRPGPMENIQEFLARMHGEKPVIYHHEDLKAILEETFGIVVYQEQIIRIASEFAGFAPGEADTIRKAVAKKKRRLLNKQRSQFIDGAMARGYSRKTCEAIWADIEFFARYGFNKAHAADYAVITCQTAFLKAHYPLEYMAALLSVERNNTDKVAAYLAEARRMGIQVTPPTINEAQLDFTIEDAVPNPMIRYGLGAIKNAGVSAVELILEERQESGRFTNVADFCERVDLRRVGKRALESMIKVGVFDDWGTRPQLLESLDRLISHSGTVNDAAAAGQMSLFAGTDNSNVDLDVELLRSDSELESIDRREVLNWEKELVGVYISEHPLNRYLELMSADSTVATTELDVQLNGRDATLLGLITYLRTHVTKKGESMAFGSLEDLHGTVELIFFPSSWRTLRDVVEVDQVYLVKGKVRVENEDRAKLVVETVETSLNISAGTSSLSAPEEPIDQSVAGEELSVVDESTQPDQTLADVNIGMKISSGSNFGATPLPPPNFEPAPEIWEEASSFLDPYTREEDDFVAWSGTPFVLAESSPAVEVGSAKELPARTILVEIEPLAEWQKACRFLVSTASKYRGRDRLRIAVLGHNLEMDFPNQNTSFNDELVRELSAQPGVTNVQLL